jgi:hypothetical protein
MTNKRSWLEKMARRSADKNDQVEDQVSNTSILPRSSAFLQWLTWKKALLILLVLPWGMLAILLAGIIFLRSYDRAQGKLIEEILSSKPERFESLDVTPIVLRYIPLGKDRQAVISELTAQGLEFEEAKEKIKRCAECDPLVILGRHINSRLIFTDVVKASYISLRFGFKQGKLVYVNGIYTIEPS